MRRSPVRLEVVMRVLADVMILNASVAVSLLAELLLRHSRAGLLLGVWWRSACVLTVMGPTIFFRMGFYTKGRSYSGRYKALIIIQAATLLFGALAFGLYFVRIQPSFPRSALLSAWVISCALLLAARLWAKLWRHVVIQETPTQEISKVRKQRSVLVIGGAGYIGSAVIPKLLAQGYRVRVLDCFLFGKEPIDRKSVV